jgi:putative ABC transport system ATP-binding protein
LSLSTSLSGSRSKPSSAADIDADIDNDIDGRGKESPTMIRAEGLSKTYPARGGGVRALQDVSLQVEAGKCLVVLGSSGSGKSTLLNTLGALSRPSSGKVFLDGTDVYALSRSARVHLRREKLGFVFQSFHLIPYLTAEENVSAAVALRGDPPTQARELLDRVGLVGRATHLPDQLSVGERQRVALARAVAGRPKIILADEPTGNLDPDSAQRISGYLRSFRDEGAAVVVVTHDPELTTIADSTLRLEAGRVGSSDG